MVVYQKEIILEPKRRGFHLITDEVLNHLPAQSGIVNVFVKHTSASLTINENADPSVRVDFENHFNKMVSEDEKYLLNAFVAKFLFISSIVVVPALNASTAL